MLLLSRSHAPREISEGDVGDSGYTGRVVCEPGNAEARNERQARLPERRLGVWGGAWRRGGMVGQSCEGASQRGLGGRERWPLGGLPVALRELGLVATISAGG